MQVHANSCLLTCINSHPRLTRAYKVNETKKLIRSSGIGGVEFTHLWDCSPQPWSWNFLFIQFIWRFKYVSPFCLRWNRAKCWRNNARPNGAETRTLPSGCSLQGTGQRSRYQIFATSTRKSGELRCRGNFVCQTSKIETYKGLFIWGKVISVSEKTFRL